MNLVRNAGYRILGRRFDYLLHTRPAEWPIMAAHTLVGSLLAVGIDGALRGERLQSGLLGMVLWVACLNGGTLALNSAFDRDEGDVAYLKRPPPPPRGLAGASLALMLAGLVAGALLLPPAYPAAYALCFAMSIVYSVPPVRLKAVAGADWLINMWGFGTLTPFAGWAATGRPLDFSRALVLLAFCPLFAALYPLTQLYQIEEDTRRGDVTLAIRLGLQRSLAVAIGAAGLSFILLGTAVFLAAGNDRALARRVVALLIAAGTWAAVLLPWYVRRDAYDARRHQQGMYQALAAWAVTDVAVVLGWAT